MSARLEQLKILAEKDPDDTFIQYAMALEYASDGQLEAAAVTLENLMAMAPGYAAAFHQAGRVYEQLERTEDARRCYERGIAAAERQGDLHARNEMMQALMLLE
jgi:Tfp pilus assembly protein PilF